jgi:hypothetical protein
MINILVVRGRVSTLFISNHLEPQLHGNDVAVLASQRECKEVNFYALMIA